MSDAPAQNQKYENHILRWFTAVLILFVIFVHYDPQIPFLGYNLTDEVQSIGRFAMPVFFMISGYFLFSKDGHSEKNVMKKAKRIFILIVFIKFFYLALDLIFWACGVKDGSNILYDFLVFGDMTSHYWFVAALLTVYLMHWLCNRYHIDYKYLIPIGVILLAVDVIIGEFLPVFGVSELFGMKIGDIAAATYVTICLFFFQLGYYIHKYREQIDAKLSTSMLLIIAVLSMALEVFEVFGLFATHIFDNTASSGPNVYVGTIIFSFAFFVLTFRDTKNLFGCRPLEWLSRNASSWLYAFVGFGVAMMQLVFLTGYKDDFMIYNVYGLFLAMAWNIASALIMYFLLVLIFSKKHPKKDSVQNQPSDN